MIFNDFSHYLNSWHCAVLRIFRSSLRPHSDPSQSLYLQCPVFYSLCEDSVWGVRKACADVFMPVSCVCSPQVHAAADQMSLLRNENRRLREELSGFNVQFFEEIEDLKFAYLTQVRR